MIIHTFDDKTGAILSPEKCCKKCEINCDICIVTFSEKLVSEILQKFSCNKIVEIISINGKFPIYILNYKGKEIAFYMTMISSTCAGTFLEEVYYLIGAKKYIMFGSCGCLNKEITAGKAIIPTEAYRDEGLSYHYALPADYIKMRNADIVAKAFYDMKIPYVKGKTWTTDGIYRETKHNMEKRKMEGCIAVEMECAGVQAVCDFRGLKLYYFLISGDLLDSPEWDRRILGNKEEDLCHLKNFYIALELALQV